MKISAFIAKNNMTQAEFGRLVGVTQGAVNQWLSGAKIAAETVIGIEKATRGKIKRHELRPDLFPKPRKALTA